MKRVGKELLIYFVKRQQKHKNWLVQYTWYIRSVFFRNFVLIKKTCWKQFWFFETVKLSSVVVIKSKVKLTICIVHVNFIEIRNTNPLKQNIKHNMTFFYCGDFVIGEKYINMQAICLHYKLKICVFKNFILIWIFYSLLFFIK